MENKLDFVEETPQEKELRKKVQNKAKDLRIRWAQKGLFDIFEIIENECILIRKPLKNINVSGFTTYLNDNFVIFLNTTYTLGHERFSAAHELGHYILHESKLKKDKILFDNQTIEYEATQFAVEFLMPEEGVREIFDKIVKLPPNKIQPRHIVRMHNYFKVSYSAMLKRLVFLGLCNRDLYGGLRAVASLENNEVLKKLEMNEGYDFSLIESSNVNYISKEYEEIIRSNFENNKISYKKLESLLHFIGKKPQDYGYEVLEDE